MRKQGGYAPAAPRNSVVQGAPRRRMRPQLGTLQVALSISRLLQTSHRMDQAVRCCRDVLLPSVLYYKVQMHFTCWLGGWSGGAAGAVRSVHIPRLTLAAAVGGDPRSILKAADVATPGWEAECAEWPCPPYELPTL